VFDQASATWISRAEVAEVAFAAQKKADRGPVTGAAVWVPEGRSWGAELRVRQASHRAAMIAA
jgi:hypothetical protein